MVLATISLLLMASFAPADPAAGYAEFSARVEEYAKLHDAQWRKLPPIGTRVSAAAIRHRELQMAALMRAARPGAKPNDICTTAAAEAFKSVLQPHLAGPDSAARASIRDENPVISREAVPMKVNGAYPSGVRLSTVPPDVLVRLPKLPEFLEYRFVGHALILRDRDANIIVDFLPGVVPAL